MRFRGAEKVIFGILVILAASGLLAAIAFNKSSKNSIPASNMPSGSVGIPSLVNTPANTTGLPLKLPEGFSISVFAKDLPGARVMAFDARGNMWVSQTSEGKISRIDIKDRTSQPPVEVFEGLKKPHGLAFDSMDNSLYIAEEGKIFWYAGEGQPLQKVDGLPSGGRHFTRTLGIGPDKKLYVSIGSSCDVCREKDERRAAIYTLDKTGGDWKKVASGLRNTVFFTWDKNGKMWGADMGRDFLGDDLPPDEINAVDIGPESSSGRAAKEPLDFGWPYCYGKNIHDTDFDKTDYTTIELMYPVCTEPHQTPSVIDLPAHSAPLGLAFVPNPPSGAWPKEYHNNLLVAFHGSWNRSAPTGYKIVRIKFDNAGNYVGMEDFISGWFPKGGKGTDAALGRPADLKFDPAGDLYISDDKAGVIYKVEYNNNNKGDKSMQIFSPAFAENQSIPSKYTCDGQNVNPPLEFKDVPSNAKSLALIMDDPDVPKNLKPDGMFVHWVAFNMPPSVTSISENQTPPGVQGLNGAGKSQYTGPCPPDREHRYFFKLYALDTTLNLSQGASKEQVLQAATGHILAQAELAARYDRKR